MSSKLQTVLGYLEADMENVDLNIQAIDEYKHQDDAEAAIAFVDDLPTSVAQEPRVQAAIIELFLHLGYVEEAQNRADDLVNATSAHPTAVYYLVLSHYFAGQPETCIEIFNKFDGESLAPMTLLLIVRCQMLMGDLDASKAMLAELEPSPEVLGMLALVELDLGDTVKATELSDQALAQSPEQYEANLVKATVLVGELAFEPAMVHIDQCLQIIPNEGRALSLLGQSYFYQLNFATAAEVFAASVASMPQHIGTWHLLAWAYLLLGELEQSEQAFNQALDLNGNFADSHGAIAVIALHKDQLEQAEHSIKVALRLDPNCATAMYAKSLLLEKQGEETASKQLIDSILQTQNQVLNTSHMSLVADVIGKMK